MFCFHQLFVFVSCTFKVNYLLTPILVCLSFDFLKEFIHLFFNNLYHFHNVDCKVLFLCFTYFKHSGLTVIGKLALVMIHCFGYCCLLKLVSKHQGLGWFYTSSCQFLSLLLLRSTFCSWHLSLAGHLVGVTCIGSELYFFSASSYLFFNPRKVLPLLFLEENWLTCIDYACY